MNSKEVRGLSKMIIRVFTNFQKYKHTYTPHTTHAHKQNHFIFSLLYIPKSCFTLLRKRSKTRYMVNVKSETHHSFSSWARIKACWWFFIRRIGTPRLAEPTTTWVPEKLNSVSIQEITKLINDKRTHHLYNVNFIPHALHRLKSIASINLTIIRFRVEGKGMLSKIRHRNAL